MVDPRQRRGVDAELGLGQVARDGLDAVAGLYDEGTFNEDMFDEGQKLAHPYHRTKFESEKLVRERVQGAWRVYRPSIVVGNSKTGEMDKIDGPYYFFKVRYRLRSSASRGHSFVFRARIRPEAKFPYETGYSSTATVRVR